MREGEHWLRYRNAQPSYLPVGSQLPATTPRSTFNNVGLPHFPAGLYVYQFYGAVKIYFKHTGRRIYQTCQHGNEKLGQYFSQNNSFTDNIKIPNRHCEKSRISIFDNGKLKYWLLDRNKGIHALSFFLSMIRPLGLQSEKKSKPNA